MIIDRLLAILAPAECLQCRAEGAVLCGTCQKTVPLPASCCYRCRRPTERYETCADCQEQAGISQVWPGAQYKGVVKEMVLQLKFHSVRAAAHDMAQLCTARHALPAAILVPIPTASSRVRARGYDQAELFAKALSHQASLPYRPVLRRLGQAHQVGAGRHARLEQLQEAYRVVDRANVAGRHVIIVDDVTTTGATLEAAATALCAAGAAKVSAVVFAQA